MILRLLLVMLLLAGIHCGWKLTSPVVGNAMLEGKMKEMVKNRGMRGERELRRDVMAFAAEKNIPLHESNLFVRVENNKTTIAAAYERDVDLRIYQHHYEFFPATDPSVKIKPRSMRRVAPTTR
ncbi:MAG: hypothetical protein HKN21_05465 [Candidatus Eisenbacteria bacterium]|uniref:Uncharacterized protein n=1 Tax=Eiseniibacteriota bacterium TaxID=2212470 RepID=A0A7Y2EA98_UNCEI|nr:hypothetical protein [Candidatus Eisenbacteria bacterium]